MQYISTRPLRTTNSTRAHITRTPYGTHRRIYDHKHTHTRTHLHFHRHTHTPSPSQTCIQHKRKLQNCNFVMTSLDGHNKEQIVISLENNSLL